MSHLHDTLLIEANRNGTAPSVRRARLMFLLALVAVLYSGSCARHDEDRSAVKEVARSTTAATPDLGIREFKVQLRVRGQSFDENVYLIFDKGSRDGIIIDPGDRSLDLEKAVKSNDILVRAILNTHGHFDHIGANGVYRSKYQADVFAHVADAEFYGGSPENKPTQRITDERDLKIGNLRVRVIHTPGHSPGSVCYLVGKHLFSGDTLFQGTIGKTDNETETATLVNNIKSRLLKLPADTLVFPGHEQRTTIGAEKDGNPFLQ